MSETKFTPGPWKISEYRNGHSMIIEGANEFDTAEVGYPNRDANAHLIAAAPELYEALETCLLYGAMTGDDWVVFKAETALAKARGEK